MSDPYAAAQHVLVWWGAWVVALVHHQTGVGLLTVFAAPRWSGRLLRARCRRQ